MNMTRIIRGTVYQVKVYYDKQDPISMEDALIHLIANSPALRLTDPAPAATLPEQAII